MGKNMYFYNLQCTKIMDLVWHGMDYMVSNKNNPFLFALYFLWSFFHPLFCLIGFWSFFGLLLSQYTLVIVRMEIKEREQ